MPHELRRPAAAAAPFRIVYPRRPLAALDAPDAPVLAAFAYGAAPADGALRVPLAPVDGGAYEIWLGTGPVTRGERHGARFAHDGAVLFAAWELDEDAHGGLEASVAEVYRRSAELTGALGYPHVFKVWHYFGAMNDGDGDDERYKRFCVGRARGMASAERLSAATAIGVQCADSALRVFLLAAKTPALPVENPRQVSAYRYPRHYSPASPAFARAALTPWGQLFVSGTAAVVGHETRHPGDVAGQFRETVENLQALVSRARAHTAAPLRPQALKLYVRRPQDEAQVADLARKMLPPAPLLVLRGDICRAELLVEVEGLYGPS